MADSKSGDQYLHKKTGAIYILDAYATIEATMVPAVVYRNIETDRVWVRPTKEFFDGRFKLYRAISR